MGHQKREKYHPAAHHISVHFDKLRLLMAKQSQPSQPLLVGQMLQVLNHLPSYLFDLLQNVHISPAPNSPELDTARQVCSDYCWADGEWSPPQPAAHTLTNAAEDTVGKDTLLVYVQIGVYHRCHLLLLLDPSGWFRHSWLTCLIEQSSQAILCYQTPPGREGTFLLVLEVTRLKPSPLWAFLFLNPQAQTLPAFILVQLWLHAAESQTKSS